VETGEKGESVAIKRERVSQRQGIVFGESEVVQSEEGSVENFGARYR